MSYGEVDFGAGSSPTRRRPRMPTSSSESAAPTSFTINRATLTLGPNVTIHGKTGQIYNAYVSGQIVNRG